MQKQINIKILDKRIGKLISFPKKITSGSAGLDLCACINHTIKIYPGDTKLISTGIAIHINDINYTAIVAPKSGLGHKQGIVLGNLIGIIDSDYQGPIMISLWNRSKKIFFLYPGAKIAQLILIPIIQIKFKIVNSFSLITKRGKKGFGNADLL